MDLNGVTEQLVTKPDSSADSLKRLVIIGGAILITCFVLFASVTIGAFPLGLLIAFGILYGGYHFYTGTFIEYEYSVFDGELEIDKVIAKRKRGHLVTIKISDFNAYDLADSIDEGSNPPTCVYAIGDEDEQWYADFNHSKFGETRLFFTPNEKMHNAIKRFLPRNKKFKF